MAIEGNIETAGAGTGGLVAAINLVRAGYKVTVYEEKSEVDHRFHLSCCEEYDREKGL
jgi:flavin-dependent dehydrogenase